MKIRGTASHVAEKYVQLARDAQSSGDPVAAENYFQHAEHYFRLIAAAQEQFRQAGPYYRGDTGIDLGDDGGDEIEDEAAGQPGLGEQPSYGTRDPQPYLPRDAQFYAPREQQAYPREQQNSARNSQTQPAADESNVERLPSFITGPGAAPSQSPSPPPAAHQGYGQNGFEGQGDRFPLHRRRRRHRGPRGDIAQGGAGEGDVPPTPRPSGD